MNSLKLAGAIDITARLIGQKLTDAWGKSVVIETSPAPRA